MRFRLLGPFEIEGDPPVSIPRRRERCLLAVLLLEQGRTITTDRLANLLWDGDPPADIRTTLRSHISRLRAALGPHAVTITRQGPGYRLDTDPTTVDAHQFRALVAQAKAVSDPARRSALLRSALQLWRGPVLEDLATTLITERLGAALEELRLEALEARISADLAAGRHRELIGELRELLAAQGNHEPFVGHLMLAMYRSGRQRDALTVYDDNRRVLASELGLRPGPELNRLHGRILRGDPTLDLIPSTVPEPIPAAAPDQHRPRQLPHDNPHFLGRSAELARLDELAGAGGPAPTIITIDGPPGAGKTALAVHFAHRVAESYPDVQLYLNLRGYGPGEPLTPAAATETLLRSLGVDGQAIPPGIEERSALLRSTLAGRNVLVLLDNARDVDQVRPLLPGSTSLVLVTSRNQLRGLSIRDGAHRITLPPMPHEDAIALLAATVGAERVRAEHDAADRLVKLCDHLPLALAIVAEHAERAATLTEVMCALENEKARLDTLGTDDPHADLRVALSWSYRALRPPAAAMFRLLGLHPAGDIGLRTAAALADLPEPEAKASLDALVSAHLVEQRRPERYELHDLIRLYATEMSAEVPPDERRAAVGRVLAWYLHAAVSADTRLLPHRRRDFVEPFRPHATPPGFAEFSHAAQWFEREYESLRAVTAWAMTGGWAGHGWRIAQTMMTLFDQTIPAYEGIAFYAVTAAQAEDAGEPLGAAYALNSAASLHMANREFTEAVPHLERARTLFRRAEHPLGEAMIVCNLGLLHGELGQLDEGLRHTAAALAMCERLDYPRGTAMNLVNRGIMLAADGQYQRALEDHRQAEEIVRLLGDSSLAATNQHHLGRTHTALGDFPQATRAFRNAVGLYRVLGNRRWEAVVLADFGTMLRDAGHPGLAGATLRTALAVLQDIADSRAADVEAELATL